MSRSEAIIWEIRVTSAKKVRRDAAPEVVEAVERGDLTLHAAEKIAASVPRAEQATMIPKVLAAKTGTRNLAAKALGQVAPRRQKAPLAHEVLTRLFRQFEDATLVLEDYADSPLPDADTATQWPRQIDHVMTTLRRYRRRLRGGGEDIAWAKVGKSDRSTRRASARPMPDDCSMLTQGQTRRRPPANLQDMTASALVSDEDAARLKALLDGFSAHTRRLDLGRANSEEEMARPVGAQEDAGG